MNKKELSTEIALQVLKESGQVFTEVFNHGSLSVEIYKPDKVDHQKPHDRDEIYVVISGTGTFLNGGNTWPFKPGDFLFVPAGVEHRFVEFTDDFSTWVFFYGPVGGEKENL
ncbi:cupin domain-containing protein [Rhodocytophaga aerolata]|uniref:Cupin domain-containing protein n=1 Tax=Rhodocytophaga aerolata TaxID=455078 RepID=A0ABT8QZM3_9BACT|nr:cupin domain-containing protein [Rhodocytophaga aerolata]MDO1445290.1 cupin domain-containing protein [Rhodocytophaga aerolata]